MPQNDIRAKNKPSRVRVAETTLAVTAAILAAVSYLMPLLGPVASVFMLLAIFVGFRSWLLEKKLAATIEAQMRERLSNVQKTLETRDQRTLRDQELFTMQAGHSGTYAARVVLPGNTMYVEQEQVRFMGAIQDALTAAGWKVNQTMEHAYLPPTEPLGVTLRRFGVDPASQEHFEDLRYAFMRAGIEVHLEDVGASEHDGEIEIIVGTRARG